MEYLREMLSKAPSGYRLWVMVAGGKVKRIDRVCDLPEDSVAVTWDGAKEWFTFDNQPIS